MPGGSTISASSLGLFETLCTDPGTCEQAGTTHQLPGHDSELRQLHQESRDAIVGEEKNREKGINIVFSGGMVLL